jgi:hypothetical protein
LRSVLPKGSILLCIFLWAKGLNVKDINKEIFPVYGGRCLSCKAFRNWVEKFSQGHWKVQQGHPVEIATDATVQQLEELILASRRMTIDTAATALECSRGLMSSTIS